MGRDIRFASRLLEHTFADVSHWHPVRDFDAYAKACTAKALGFKVTQGGYTDPTFAHALHEAERRELVALGYEYQADQVSNFLWAFPPRAGRIPILDFEGAGITVAEAEGWIAVVHKEWDRYPGFYGHSQWLALGSPRDTAVAQCPYWGPTYGDDLKVPDGVGQPFAWQCNDGVIGPGPHQYAGIGACDFNLLLVTPERLHTYAGLLTPKPVKNPPWPGRVLHLTGPKPHEWMRGDDVLVWKHRLGRLGYTVSQTPFFGGATERATKRLQRKHKLPETGRVDRATWNAAWPR